MRERWLSIKGYRGYSISNKGRVRRNMRYSTDSSGQRWVSAPYLINTWLHRKGYVMVTLYRDGSKKNFYIHRLVATHFLEPYEGYEVDHLDRDKTNNCVTNLEWVSGLENLRRRDMRRKDGNYARKVIESGSWA